MTHNLQPKCITDFTTEDTIYISRKEQNTSAQTYLCQFKEYKGAKVVGVIIAVMTNPDIHKHEIGKEVSNYLRNCSLYGEDPISGHSHYHTFKNTGYAIYPQAYNSENENAEIIKNHPSFGMIRLSRQHSSRHQPLFGSSIKHSELISITIAHGEVDRKLSSEWYHAKREIVEVVMSATQFAEFITTPNSGSGIPCTIAHIDHTVIPEPPYESRREMYSSEFGKTMKNMATEMVGQEEILKAILSKPTITKSDRKEIEDLFHSFTRKIDDHVPDIEKQFVRQMDKTVTEAKGELDAFVQRRLTEEGRKVLLGETGDSAILIEHEEETNHQ